MNNCEPFRELIEAYALGALDSEERAAFEAHLATGCLDCAQRVAEARALVSQLAYLAPGAEPSPPLKGWLMQTVRNEARAAQPVRQAKTRVPVWLWAGVAALLVMTLYAAWDAKLLRDEVRQVSVQATTEMQQRQRLQTQLAILQREKSILTDPASVKIALPSSNPQMPELEATWHSELGLIVSGRRVSLPTGDRVLQLWLIPKAPGGKPIPSLTIRPSADGKVFLLVANPPEGMGETRALAITEEPAGGSPQPTTASRWAGGVS